MKSSLLLAVLCVQTLAFAPPLATTRRSASQSSIFLSAEPESSSFDDYQLGQQTLAFKDEVVGTGEGCKPGEVLTIAVVGKVYPSGVQFADNEAFVFELGAGKAFPGFDNGLAGAKVGTKRILRVPPGLAFGTSGTATIPPNSDLQFDCEVKAIARDQLEMMMAKVGTDRALIIAAMVALLAFSPFLA